MKKNKLNGVSSSEEEVIMGWGYEYKFTEEIGLRNLCDQQSDSDSMDKRK